MDTQANYTIRPSERDFSPPAGHLAVTADRRLVLLDAAPAYAAILRQIVETLNEQAAVHVKRLVPRPAGSAVAFVDVAREDEEFGQAVIDHFEQQYNLRLAPAADA